MVVSVCNTAGHTSQEDSQINYTVISVVDL